MNLNTRGRKPFAEPEAHSDALNRAALAEDNAALTQVAQISAAIADAYGDGLPYDRLRLVNEAKFYAGQAATAMLELGKRLVQIKENEPHGDFIAIVEERLGIKRTAAFQLMKAAVKFSAPQLANNAHSPALLSLERSKLFELMGEADEDLEELMEGGTLAGATLDDMQGMTVRELRAALKKERDERAKGEKAKQKVIDGKENKISALEEQLARRESAEPSELELYQLDKVRDASLAAEMALRQLVGELATVLESPSTELAATAARQAAEYVAQLFAGLLQERDVPVQFEEIVQPEWAKVGQAGKR